MIGVLVNTAAVLIGSFVGFFIKKGIPKKVTDAVMIAVGVSVLCIGINGILQGENTLALIISLVLGAIVGSLIDIDKWLNKLAQATEKKFSKNSNDSTFAQAFLSGTLLFCIGSMAVVGSLNAGISGDNQTLFAKSLLDMISSLMIASSLGIGVVFSAASVFIYQGAIVLAAKLLVPVLTDIAVAELNCTGSALIILLSFNLLGITKFKVANYLPALIFAPVITYIIGFFN